MASSTPSSVKNRLIVISAPSGAGKTTLCQRLLRDFEELELSISSTTRAPRGQEQHGKEYLFLSQDDFKARIERGDFAEWALVHGNYYGTSKEVITSAFKRGKSVLLDIDVQGAESLKKSFPRESVLIFISPPSLEVLEQRLRARGTDKEESIQRRMKNARDEMARIPAFERVIVNDDLERSYVELKQIVKEALRG